MAKVVHGNRPLNDLSVPHMLRIEHLAQYCLTVLNYARRQARGGAYPFVAMRDFWQVAD